MNKELLASFEATAELFYGQLVLSREPGSQDLLERLRIIRPGDWVAEVSTGYKRKPDGQRIGKFLREEEVDDGHGSINRVIFIESVEGKEIAWTNYNFIRLPKSIHD